ncbi:ATP-dependent nuclease, partial [Neisseria sp. P0009.S007]
YERRPGKIFYEINTQNIAFTSTSEKIKAIKEHLGINNNDGWELLPFNVLVEGEEDKKYLEKLMEAVDIEIPNIICAGGATKIAGYLQY